MVSNETHTLFIKHHQCFNNKSAFIFENTTNYDFCIKIIGDENKKKIIIIVSKGVIG